jgi:hypothetical protein
MKTGWRKFATRKDKLESIACRMHMEPHQAAEAWGRLREKMFDLSEPAAARVPKFNDLLLAIVAAGVRGRMTR